MSADPAPACLRHPAEHGRSCHCGQPATKHVRYGSGCGNVCDVHAAAVKRVKVGAYREGELVLTDPLAPGAK